MTVGMAPQGLKDALVILGAAGIVIPAFARLKISPVIGFIIVGMIAGPFGLGALAQTILVGRKRFARGVAHLLAEQKFATAGRRHRHARARALPRTSRH